MVDLSKDLYGLISRDCEGRSGKTPPFTVGMKAEPFAPISKTINLIKVLHA